MLGYYKAPEQNRDAMTDDGWLRTGDKGHIDDQGVLRITGRVKDMFKTGKGKYVAPAPIEDKLVIARGRRGLRGHRCQSGATAGHLECRTAPILRVGCG